MGIPALFRWVTAKYPKVVSPAEEEEALTVDGEPIPVDWTAPNPNKVEYDNLYLDMNGIVHPCCHPEDRPAPKTEDEMYAEVFKYIDRILRIVRPRKLLYMAIDGVAPRAKMNQQRSRRFRSALDAFEKLKADAEAAAALPGGADAREQGDTAHFDSNCITPGTPFMERLAEALRYYIAERMASDAAWAGLKVILSDASVPGEGEHKIMDYIRRQRLARGYNPNLQHVMYGLDADLIMLSLATHEVNFCILREDVFWRGTRDSERPVDGGVVTLPPPRPYVLLHVPILREYLEIELRPVERLSFGWSLDRAVDDWVFLCFFVGNDFLPHLPSLEIREGAIDLLVELYKRHLPRFGGYLTDSGELHLERVERILSDLGRLEDDIFRHRREKEERQRQRAQEQRDASRAAREAREARGPRGARLAAERRVPQGDVRKRALEAEPEIARAARERDCSFGAADAPPDKRIRSIRELRPEDDVLIKLSGSQSRPALPKPGDVLFDDVVSRGVSSGGGSVSAGLGDIAGKPFIKADAEPEVEAEVEAEVEPEVEPEAESEVEAGAEAQAVPEDDAKEPDSMPQPSSPSSSSSSSSSISDDDEDVTETEKKDEKTPEPKDEKSDEPHEPEDLVRLWEPGWKGRYYQQKFSADVADAEFRKTVVKHYVEGCCWVLKYYYQGCQSWSWYFPFHFSPFASDFVGLNELEIKFELAAPLRPFEQLMGVLPAASRAHIPGAWRYLMTDPTSAIIDFYPEQFPIDMNGKRHAWQGVALLPFIDEARLHDALAVVYPLLSDAEIIRNSCGRDIVYFTAAGSETLASLVPQLYENGSVDEPVEIPLAPEHKAMRDFALFGALLPDPQFVPLHERVPTALPLPECADVMDNCRLSAAFVNPEPPSDDYVFPARVLDGARAAPRTLDGSDVAFVRSGGRSGNAPQGNAGGRPGGKPAHNPVHAHRAHVKRLLRNVLGPAPASPHGSSGYDARGRGRGRGRSPGGGASRHYSPETFDSRGSHNSYNSRGAYNSHGSHAYGQQQFARGGHYQSGPRRGGGRGGRGGFEQSRGGPPSYNRGGPPSYNRGGRGGRGGQRSFGQPTAGFYPAAPQHYAQTTHTSGYGAPPPNSYYPPPPPAPYPQPTYGGGWAPAGNPVHPSAPGAPPPLPGASAALHGILSALAHVTQAHGNASSK